MLTKIDCHEWQGTIYPTKLSELLGTIQKAIVEKRSDNPSSLWCIPLSRDSGEFEHCFSLLTDAEKSRADRFRHEGARTQFVIGHGVIHLLLNEYLGNNYAHISWKESEHHKPFVQLPDGSRPLEFNLSHCEDYIAIALGSTSQGVDIENIRSLKDLEGISRQVFTEKEISILFASDDRDTQNSTFFKFWTCKEAVLKANGTGFMKDPKKIEIDLNPTESSNEHRVYWYGSLEKHSVAWTENLSL